MRFIALAATTLLLAGPAFGQTTIPTIPPTNPANVPQAVSTVNSLVFSAGIAKLDVAEVRTIPALNSPTSMTLQGNLNSFLFSINPQ